MLIDRVIDIRNGKILNSDLLIGFDKDEQDIFMLRTDLEKAIQKDEGFLVCPYCLQKVKLRSSLKENKYQMHFAHLFDSDDCPIKTNTKLTKEELLALQYNGCKESDLHKEIKSRLIEVLRLDNRFENAYEEKVVKSFSDRKSWKKPDVQADFNSVKRVFEIQLSTTFLSVIVSRELFYADNDISLIWIFNEFNPNDTKFTERDVFYNNNCNALVFDDECYVVSKKDKKLKLKVHYFEFASDELSSETVRTKLVDFSDLIFRDRKVFIYDHDKAKKKRIYMNLKDSFFTFIREHQGIKIDVNIFNDWLIKFGDYNLPIWQEDVMNKYDLLKLFTYCLSIKDQTVYGSGFKNGIELINHMYHSNRELFKTFYTIISDSDGLKQIYKIDKKHTVMKIIEKYESEEFNYTDKYNSYLSWFFVELKNYV